MSFDNLRVYSLSISMCMQNFITIFHSVQEIGPFYFFRIGARQRLDRWKLSFRNLLGKILLISMFTQKFIKIFHSVKEKGPFSRFQNLAFGKASNDDKCHFAIPWARSCQYQCVCKILSRYFKRFKSYISLFSEYEPRQNLDGSQMSFDYLIGYIMSISMCMQNFITVFHSVQEIGPFSLYRIWSSVQPRPMKNVISQSLGLDLDNINVYAEVYQYIPHSSKDKAIFTFSEFGARQSLDRW